MIERVLVLIRNVLQVPANPEAECRADNDASLHDQVIWALHQSGLMDLVLFVVSSPDEHQFHLHGLEILCLLYREQVSICSYLCDQDEVAAKNAGSDGGVDGVCE